MVVVVNLRNGSNQYATKEGVTRDTPSKNSDGDTENADFRGWVPGPTLPDVHSRRAPFNFPRRPLEPPRSPRRHAAIADVPDAPVGHHRRRRNSTARRLAGENATSA